MNIAEKLKVLDIAREQARDARIELERGESLYRFAIDILENAMNNDPEIIRLREKLSRMVQIEKQAMIHACVILDTPTPCQNSNKQPTGANQLPG